MLKKISILTIFLLTGCTKETKPPLPTDTVATVGGAPLLHSDLDHAKTTAGNRPATDVLRLLADEEALAQMARAEGLDRDPSVRAAVRRILAARVQEKHLSNIAVSEEEVAAALTERTESAPKPSLHLAFLRQKFTTSGGKSGSMAALEKARTAWQALPDVPPKTNFGALAVDYSDDPDTRYQGGDAGWCKSGERHLFLPIEATAAASALTSPGLVPEILCTEDAAWLVLVSEIRTQPPSPPNSGAVRVRLEAAKQSAAREELYARARAAAPFVLVQPLPADPQPSDSPDHPPEAP